ncbi:hypothetical protein V8D89_009592 [Ganoderma adspersum]
MAIAIARWGSRIADVAALAKFFKAAEGGTEAAAPALFLSSPFNSKLAAAEVASWAEQAEKTLHDVGVVNEEVNQARTSLGHLSTLLTVFGSVGLVVTTTMDAIMQLKGAEQKERLIAAIHGLQTVRLTTAFFRQEGRNVVQQQLETLHVYLDSSAGSDAEPMVAASMRDLQIAEKLVNTITENGATESDLNKLEVDLEAQDRTANPFYSGDDLGHDAVVSAASASASATK